MLPNRHIKTGLAHCPSCETALVAPFHAAGHSVRCSSCGSRFCLPQADELFEEAIAYLIERDDHGRDYDPYGAEFDQPQHVGHGR